MLIDVKAYDSHCNLVLGEVEETVYVVEEDENEEEVVKVGCDLHPSNFKLTLCLDNQQEIRDVVRTRYADAPGLRFFICSKQQ